MSHYCKVQHRRNLELAKTKTPQMLGQDTYWQLSKLRSWSWTVGGARSGGQPDQKDVSVQQQSWLWFSKVRSQILIRYLDWRKGELDQADVRGQCNSQENSRILRPGARLFVRGASDRLPQAGWQEEPTSTKGGSPATASLGFKKSNRILCLYWTAQDKRRCNTGRAGSIRMRSQHYQI